MLAVLAFVFLVLPVVELAVILTVGRTIGVLNTLALLVLVSVAGAWLVKREGMGVWRRFRRQVEAGMVPAREVADGAMIMLAGAMLLTPGFVTDVVALLLLLPPVRAMVRASLIRRVAFGGGLRRIRPR